MHIDSSNATAAEAKGWQVYLEAAKVNVEVVRAADLLPILLHPVQGKLQGLHVLGQGIQLQPLLSRSWLGLLPLLFLPLQLAVGCRQLVLQLSHIGSRRIQLLVSLQGYCSTEGLRVSGHL